MNRKLKRFTKTKGVKIEDEEARKFDANYRKIINRFYNFLFNNGDGSFILFDLEYRQLAGKPYVYIKPDIDHFFNYAIKR